MTKYWIVVASAEHARRGRAGFMQVNHGKKAPLQRIRAGDGVTYYSPAETIGGKDRLQSFTTIGRVRDEALYQGVMGGVRECPGGMKASCGIEFPDQERIFREGFRGCDVFNPMFFPESVRIPERGNP